jgi:hypothetical protein
MNDTILKSGWETLLVAVPFVVVSLIGLFRLDELLVRRKDETVRKRSACGLDKDGEPILTDPDGRPWRKHRLHK